MKNLLNQLKVWLPIAISLVALVISVFSYKLSERIYDYEKSRDMLIYTPAIKEDVDSVDIAFTLNSNNAVLQGLKIIFPYGISNNPISINTKPIRLNKIALEILIEQIIGEFIKPQQSIASIGTFSIPVMIDYSAIVYGYPQTLRENRLFVFEVYCDEFLNVSYSNSILINRYGFPLKTHYFYTGPFSSSLDDKVHKQDEKDIQELLEKQLENCLKNMNNL